MKKYRISKALMSLMLVFSGASLYKDGSSLRTDDKCDFATTGTYKVKSKLIDGSNPRDKVYEVVVGGKVYNVSSAKVKEAKGSMDSEGVCLDLDSNPIRVVDAIDNNSADVYVFYSDVPSSVKLMRVSTEFFAILLSGSYLLMTSPYEKEKYLNEKERSKVYRR